MSLFDFISKYISEITGVSSSYIDLFLYSFISYIFVKVFVKIICFFNTKFNSNERTLYLINKKVIAFGVVVNIILLILIWESKITKLMTLISFVSAALAFALRDFVYNFFAGIYINVKKPFKVEDRVEVDGIVGDVVNISSLTFDILEVSSKDNGEQSTGIMIHIPNSKVFNGGVKNYTEAFKYIWDEISVRVPIDSDIDNAKSILYDIVRNNEVVKRIPRKMKSELNSAIGEYRIYYNKLDPIIYTSIEDSCVVLTIRYLAHPKKVRNIRSDIYTKVLEAFRDKKIVICK
mgnify:FL=1